MRTARVFGLGSRVLETQRILSGTGAQQTQNRWMAQTVEVVRNHEGGTDSRVEPGVRNRGWKLRQARADQWDVGCRAIHAGEFHGRRMTSVVPADQGVPEGEARSGGNRAFIR